MIFNHFESLDILYKTKNVSKSVFYFEKNSLYKKIYDILNSSLRICINQFSERVMNDGYCRIVYGDVYGKYTERIRRSHAE